MRRRPRVPAPTIAVLGAVLVLLAGAGAAPAAPTPGASPGAGEAERGLPCPSLPDRSKFVKTIDDPYLPLLPGMVLTSKGTSDGEAETNVVEVTVDTKTILGVETTEVLDIVRDAKGDLVEKTFDWFAQDEAGDVWYSGEDSDDYENGKVVSTKGSWIAGVKNA